MRARSRRSRNWARRLAPPRGNAGICRRSRRWCRRSRGVWATRLRPHVQPGTRGGADAGPGGPDATHRVDADQHVHGATARDGRKRGVRAVAVPDNRDMRVSRKGVQYARDLPRLGPAEILAAHLRIEPAVSGLVSLDDVADPIVATSADEQRELIRHVASTRVLPKKVRAGRYGSQAARRIKAGLPTPVRDS